jgi:hypothetical protein
MHAVVIVERAPDAADGVHAQASARFVQVPASASLGEALRSIGANLELPSPGTCAAPSHALAAAETEPYAPFVELSDVGAVSIEIAGGASTRLVPRQLPDVTDVVSGVVYARAVEAPSLPAASLYVLHVGGGPAVGAFDLAATAPADATDLTIAGEQPSGTLVVSDAPVLISWAAQAADTVYADLQPTGLRCTLSGHAAPSESGSGRATLPTALFNGAATLTLHRLRREPLAARGVDDGELRFDFARSVVLVHASP